MIDLQRILVIDIEATCWEKEVPADQENEIIEVGIVILHTKTGEITDKESILVRPEKSKVSHFCTQLTTLTQDQVNAGTTFEKACNTLRKKYKSKDRTWASWGDYDRSQFERQCRSREIPYPFGPRHINIKNLYAILYQLPREIGLKKALDRMGEPFEGTHHRGDDDAWNIAKVFSKTILHKEKHL